MAIWRMALGRMAIGRIAGPGSIAVSLALIITIAVVLILSAMERGAQRPSLTPRAVAKMAAVAPPAPKPAPKNMDQAPAYPPRHIRLPPPPRTRQGAASQIKTKMLRPPAAKTTIRPPTLRAMTPLRPAKAKPQAKPTPKPKPRMVLRVRETPKPPQAKPQPPKPQATTPAAKTPPPPPPITTATKGFDGARIRKAGRVLLKLREHGKGPTVEIAWPDSSAARHRLYRRLARCYGMRAAVLDGQDRLFAAGGAPGRPWNIDLDRFSGFLRSPVGQPIPEESRVFADIGARHHLADWRPVRIFPRNVDAVLLGGLHHIVGPSYASARSITAAYIPKGSRLMLGAVRVDSRAMKGWVDLTGAAKFTCRRRAGG